MNLLYNSNNCYCIEDSCQLLLWLITPVKMTCQNVCTASVCTISYRSSYKTCRLMVLKSTHYWNAKPEPICSLFLWTFYQIEIVASLEIAWSNAAVANLAKEFFPYEWPQFCSKNMSLIWISQTNTHMYKKEKGKEKKKRKKKGKKLKIRPPVLPGNEETFNLNVWLVSSRSRDSYDGRKKKLSNATKNVYH